MALHPSHLIVSVVALAMGVALATDAQALQRVHHRHLAARGGDVVVHTGRSYLDPGTSADVGSENHYFSDSTHYPPEGPGFTSTTAGFELLPTPLNPPGRQEPLFPF